MDRFIGGTSNQTDPAQNGIYKHEYAGQRFGIQLAYMLGRVAIGVDGSFGKSDFKHKDPHGALLGEADLHTSLISGILMYRGERLAPWIGLVFKGDIRYDHASESTLDSAGGLVFGLGYKVLSWLQINAEFRSYHFDTYKVSGTEVKLPTTTQDTFQVSEGLIGLSIPFELKARK